MDHILSLKYFTCQHLRKFKNNLEQKEVIPRFIHDDPGSALLIMTHVNLTFTTRKVALRVSGV